MRLLSKDNRHTLAQFLLIIEGLANALQNRRRVAIVTPQPIGRHQHQCGTSNSLHHPLKTTW
eukprot:366522-Chlamydomonas_euryale.AAC.24